MDLKVKIYQALLKNSFSIPVKVVYWNQEEYLIGGEGEPVVTVRFNSPVELKELRKDPTLALAEAYMDKVIEVDGSLQELMLSAFKNSESFVENRKYRLLRLVHKHDKKGNQEDIQYHYDIGNDFYKFWLDSSMTYSCAYFENEDQSLEDAQYNKIIHTLKKLRLKEGEHLLDIGCGWGDLIITAAKEFGVKATGCTLSQEQFALVNEKIKKENLEGLVEVKILDYRDAVKMDERYDKIVSIGMFEHVGKADIPKYFKCVKELLKPEGFALIHGISGQRDIDDETAGYNSFINKYIFPGGYIPSLAEIVSPINKEGMHLVDLESMRRQYQLTLEEWHRRFMKNWDEISKTKDERFMRMWDVYLQSCAAVFESGQLDVCQYLIEKGTDNTRPLTREYTI